jgi:hypothetical protein
MNDILNAALALLPIPAKYVPIILLSLPYVTKVIYGAVKGQGIRGMWRSIWFGSAHIEPTATPNVPAKP